MNRAAIACVAVVLSAGGCATSSSEPAGGHPAPFAATSPANTSRNPPGSPVRSSGPRLAGTVVAIDPGHNGDNDAHPEIINRHDAGTLTKPCDTTGTQTDGGYPEAEFAFDVANRLADRLRGRGVTVVLTRQTNSGVGPCITERAAIGNEADADGALSVHADGGPASGVGFHVIQPAPIAGKATRIASASHRLALEIRRAYRDGTGEPYASYIGRNGLDTRDDLGGLNLSTAPKVFIECGNMRNPKDAARLSDPAFREQIAAALEAGLVRFLAANG